MAKHISDSERLTQAILNKREAELSEAKRAIREYQEQLRTMKSYITELKDCNNRLAAQIRYLVNKKIHEDQEQVQYEA